MKDLLNWKLMFTLLVTFAVYMYIVAPMFAPKANGGGTAGANGNGARKAS